MRTITGDDVRALRGYLSQRDFAIVLGVHQAQVSWWERGVRPIPRYIAKLIEAQRQAIPGETRTVVGPLAGYGEGPEDLFGDDAAPEPGSPEYRAALQRALDRAAEVRTGRD